MLLRTLHNLLLACKVCIGFFFQLNEVGEDRHEIYNQAAENTTNVTQNTCYLRVEHSDTKGDKHNYHGYKNEKLSTYFS